MFRLKALYMSLLCSQQICNLKSPTHYIANMQICARWWVFFLGMCKVHTCRSTTSIGTSEVNSISLWATIPFSRVSALWALTCNVAARGKLIFLVSWPFQSFHKVRKLATLPNYVMWMTTELLPKIWVFVSKCRWSPTPSKLEGPHEVILGDIPFFMKQATCALSFFQIHPV